MFRGADDRVGRVGFDSAHVAVAVASALAIAFACLYLALLPVRPDLFGSRDFTVYWATGQQLVRHANPYDRTEDRVGLVVSIDRELHPHRVHRFGGMGSISALDAHVRNFD